jgi:hypothetical protein
MVSVIFSDFFLWPYNLARDFPRRVGRLVGALAAWPDILERAPFIAWFYTVICYLFDLSGGPEILELLLRSTTDTRPLNEAETAMATAIVGPKAIRYRDVRIAQRGILRQAFRLNKGRAFATWHTINLPDRRDENLPLLIHELTHVFQYERVGSVYIGQGLWAQYQLGRKAYDYGGPTGLADGRAAGKRYSDYNREQQGQITQDYCSLKLSGKNTAAYDPFIDELQAGAI